LDDHGWDQTTDLVFISGKARTGADNMVIEFCQEFGYDWVEYPAQWRDEHGKLDMGAGYRRNQEMANVANYAVLFWDGMSRGTDHMHNACMRRFKKKQMLEEPFTYIVEPDPAPVYEDLFWS
jgi:hypothetical protein